MNAFVGAAIAGVAGLLLAGCGLTSTVDGVAATVPPERLADCPPTTVGETLPTDAAPVAVLQCGRRTELVPGDGEWKFDVRAQDEVEDGARRLSGRQRAAEVVEPRP